MPFVWVIREDVVGYIDSSAHSCWCPRSKLLCCTALVHVADVIDGIGIGISKSFVGENENGLVSPSQSSDSGILYIPAFKLKLGYDEDMNVALHSIATIIV